MFGSFLNNHEIEWQNDNELSILNYSKSRATTKHSRTIYFTIFQKLKKYFGLTNYIFSPTDQVSSDS